MSAEILLPSVVAVGAVVQALARGDLCVIPTDTVYGVASRVEAGPVRRLYVAKGRPESRPIPVLVAGHSAVQALAAEWPSEAAILAQRFWPGALTLVVPARDWLPAEVTGETNTVGMRWPSGDLVQQVIRQAGGMLAVTSANRSGEPAATTATEAAAALGGAVTYILDGGDLSGNRASTVVALDGDGLRLLREGPIGRDEIEATLRRHRT